jgi:hypothetical protein
MCWRAWNKMIVVSASLAVGGMLVCVAGLLDVLVPQGSVLGFVAGMAALGVVITLVVAGYVWLCDKFEDYVSERLDRLAGMENQTRRDATGNSKRERRVPRAPDDHSGAPRFPQPSDVADRYVEGLRALVKPKAGPPRRLFSARQWHGQ